MICLKLMPPLTRLVGQKEVAVGMSRATLRAVLEEAAARNGKFRTAMLDAEGKLSSEYSCLVNGRRHNVTDLDGVEVDEADEIVILMPLAGGAPPPRRGAEEQGCGGATTRGHGDGATRRQERNARE